MEALDVFPLSEIVYVKRSGTNETGWIVIDLYRIGPGYSLQLKPLGNLDGNKNIQPENASDARMLFSSNTAIVPTSVRRHNLMGLVINCGLVVCIPSTLISHLLCVIPCACTCAPQISFPERFTTLDDPHVDHVDIWAKATLPIGNDLRRDLNMR